VEQADVTHAIAALQAAGKAVSVQNLRRTLGYGSLRDIIKYRNQLLPQEGTSAMDAVRDDVPCVTTPVPLLKQAQMRVEDTHRAENTARKAWDLSRSNVVFVAELNAAQKAHRQAQDWLAQVERGIAQLRQAMPEEDLAIRLDESALAAMQERHRKEEARAQAQLAQRRAQRAQMAADYVQMTGEEA
jgi:hypothetical protein